MGLSSKNRVGEKEKLLFIAFFFFLFLSLFVCFLFSLDGERKIKIKKKKKEGSAVLTLDSALQLVFTPVQRFKFHLNDFLKKIIICLNLSHAIIIRKRRNYINNSSFCFQPINEKKGRNGFYFFRLVELSGYLDAKTERLL